MQSKSGLRVTCYKYFSFRGERAPCALSCADLRIRHTDLDLVFPHTTAHCTHRATSDHASPLRHPRRRADQAARGTLKPYYPLGTPSLAIFGLNLLSA